MVTKLDKAIKREIEVDGKAFTVTISAEGIKLVEKRHRKGKVVTWSGLIALGVGGEDTTS
jgi:ribosomal protein L28